jgi:hypothetical protein
MSQIKSFSIVITDACMWIETETVLQKFSELEIGVISKIDVVNASSQGRECKKFFIHFSSINETDHAQRLCLKLIDNQKRQKEGELFTPIKIIYGRTRDGRDQYWKIFMSQTPSDRAAAYASKSSEFKPRIEM